MCPSLSSTNFQFLIPPGSFHPEHLASAMAPLKHHTSMRACTPSQNLQQYYRRVSLVLGLRGDSCLGGLEYLWSSLILPRASVSPVIKCSGVGTCVSPPILTAYGCPSGSSPGQGLSAASFAWAGNESKCWAPGKQSARAKRKICHRFSCVLNFLVPDASLLVNRKCWVLAWLYCTLWLISFTSEYPPCMHLWIWVRNTDGAEIVGMADQ